MSEFFHLFGLLLAFVWNKETIITCVALCAVDVILLVSLIVYLSKTSARKKAEQAALNKPAEEVAEEPVEETEEVAEEPAEETEEVAEEPAEETEEVAEEPAEETEEVAEEPVEETEEVAEEPAEETEEVAEEPAEETEEVAEEPAEETEEVAEEPAEETEEVAEEPAEETEEVAEEPAEKTEEVAEEPAEKTEEVAEEPAEETEEVVDEDDFDDENEEESAISENAKIHFVSAAAQSFVNVAYNRSNEARMIQADEKSKEYYSLIKNELLSYKGVKARKSWRQESFRVGRKLVAKLQFRGKTLCLYLAIDPKQYEESKYIVEDVSETKKNAEVPCLYRIKNERRARYSKDLIAEALADTKAVRKEKEYVDYVVPYEETDALIERGLIKVVAVKSGSGEPADDEVAAAAAVEEVADELVKEVAEEPVEEVAEEPVEEVVEEPVEEVAEEPVEEVAEEPVEEVAEEPVEEVAEEPVEEVADEPVEEVADEPVEEVAEEPVEEVAEEPVEEVAEEPVEEVAEEPVEEVAEEPVEEVAEEPVEEVAEEPVEEVAEEPVEEVAEEPVEEVAEEPVEEVAEEPVEEVAEEPVEETQPEHVKINVSEAHVMMEDDVAETFVETSVRVSDKSKSVVVNVDTLNEYFKDGERVTLDEMKERIPFVSKKTTYVKILARGYLDKSLEVEADDFSLDAIKMIVLAGGKVFRTQSK